MENGDKGIKQKTLMGDLRSMEVKLKRCVFQRSINQQRLDNI